MEQSTAEVIKYLIRKDYILTVTVNTVEIS